MTDGAPEQLEATADSTWSGDNVYALMLTLHGGAIAHSAKMMHLILDSSTESEAVATSKVGELVKYTRNIMRAIGIEPNGPTFVGARTTAPTRSSPPAAPSRPASATACGAT